MLLGRTYDMQHDVVGIDIYDQKYIDDAANHKIPADEVTSNYMTIERSSEKRDFLGISGELAIKVSSGLVDIKGAGDYLKDTSNAEKSIEVLVKLTFTTVRTLAYEFISGNNRRVSFTVLCLNK
ncbi:stonustoxin subunit alpha [Trichonephila clavipes]|nr:stonustoxin subunit alpha [Trichonephila clavipes]